MSSVDTAPLLRALAYVVEEGRKHAAAGHEDHFVAVARAANAALLWERNDAAGDYELAEKYLGMIPFPSRS